VKTQPVLAEVTMSERDLFIAALMLTEPAERAAWLDRECAGDAALRQRIDVLLQAFDKAGSLLENPVVATGLTTDEPITESPGTVIGPYKLLEQIGEGGFGVVFMAEQEQPIRRKVALKVLKPGMDTRQVIARFEVERQALALMDHPNIAKVLDGGETATGRPYFVMDLIKGLPITEYCDQNRLTPRQRLELFLPVCQAVQHAHQKGVIHRDLKPSNVVVSQHDGVPCAKVIDFGIAKAMGQQLTDKTLFTGFAQLIGTPLYMSPEQAAGGPDIDTRSDIYSLGVLLYELLSGTTPFDKERFSKVGYGEICRIIREEEPPKPSTRISTLHADSRTQSRAAHAGSGSAEPLTTVRGSIDTIATKRKSDPKRLSQLFRGELDWIVMKALEKDRNRRYESASAFAADIQRYLHDEPVQACPPSAAYRLRKFARRNKTGLAVAGVVLLFIMFLGGGAGWVVRDKAARQAQTTSQVQELLTNARGLLAANDVPRARQKLAEAKSRIGNDRDQLGSLPDDVESLDAELERFERFLELVEKAHEAEFPQPVRQQEIGAERDRARAVPFLLEALSCYGVLEQDDWSVRVEAGRLGPDQVTRVRRTVYEELLWLADDAVRRWQVHVPGLSLFSAPGAAAKAALAYLHQAETAGPRTSGFYEIRARCRYAQDQVEAARKDLELARQTPGTFALEHYLLGLDAYDAQNKAEAVQQFQAALRVEPTHYWSLLWMGHTLAQLGQQEQDWLAAAAVYTGCIMKRPEHAAAYLGRGNVFWKLKRAEEAEADYRAALQFQPDLAEAHDNLGLALDKRGKLDEAIAEYQKAIAEYDKLKPSDFTLSELHWNLGTALNKQGKRNEALAEYHKYTQFGGKHVGEAIEAYRQAIKLDPQFALAHYYLGKALHRTNKPRVGTPVDEMIAEYQKAIELDPKIAEAYVDLGGWLLSKERYAEAVTAYRRGHELGAKQVGGYSPADLLRMAEQKAALDARLPKILNGEDQPSDAERLTLAQLCASKARYAAAARFYAEAFAARPDPNTTPETRPKIEDRHHAAIAAMRAASGQGVDAVLDDAERTRLRWQALDWLRAYLASCPTLEKEPRYGHKLARRLSILLMDHDFVLVRVPGELAKLPERERQAWQQLWNDLADMLKWTHRWAAPERSQDVWTRTPIDNILKQAFNANQLTVDQKLHLAHLYQRQGKYNEAETLFQEVLQAAEKRGADDLFTLRCKAGLAQFYLFQGKYALAETLYQDVLQGETAKLGPDHRDVLDTKSELARVYTEQGKYDRAEPILEELVKAQTAKLGAHHPSTLFSRSNLASLYQHLEKYDRAEMLLQEVVQADTAQRGADHRDTLISKHNLALLYFDQGKDDRAEQLLQEVIQAQKTKLPADHPDALNCKKSLASVYLNQGKYDHAELISREVLQAQTAKLGANHPTTLHGKHGLARLYYAQGRYAKAEPLFLEAIDGMRKTLGIGHPDAQYYIHNLALCYLRMKHPDKAEEILRELVDFAKQHGGTDSPHYASNLAALGLALLEQNRAAEAEKTLRESLAISEKRKSESWNAFNARSILGGALLAQKKYADAEPFLLQGYEGMKEREAKIKRMDRVALTETLERLVQLYDAWGKTDKADQWRNKLQTERRSK
jgi:serine/threonine protein kinase/Tfp pilus assembly protein PilF